MDCQGPTARLVDFVLETGFQDLPSEVIEKTKQLTLDTIGSALGGYLTDIGAICLGIVDGLGGNAQATMIGSGRKTSCANAAFANAKLANALDCDEAFFNAAHFCSPTVSAALAIGEYTKSSGRDVIAAIALGYDVTARVAISCIQPTIPLSLAWHTVGSIVASAKLLGLDKEGTLNALGIGCANAPLTCIWKSWPQTMIKYGDMGVIAYQGVLAALMAQMGHTGSKDVLEGDYGLWRYIGAERCDYGMLLSELGKKWYVMDSAMKLYPACRWLHAALDLFAQIVKDNCLKPGDIEKVIVRVHRTAANMGSKYDPEDWLSAQLSIPYNIALIAFGITPSSEWQTPEHYKDPELLSFHRKVSVEEDPDSARIMSAADQPTYGFRRASTSIEVTSRSGEFRARAEYARGDPWLPEKRMTEQELRDKFRAFASRVAESSLRWRIRIEKIIEKISHMEEINNIGDIMQLVAP